MNARMTFALGPLHTNKWDGNSYSLLQNFHSAQRCVPWNEPDFLAIPCAWKNKKTLHVAALCIAHTVDTQMYRQQRVPLSLLATDKPASEGTNRRDFCMPICSAALNQPSAIVPEPPGLSKGLLLPNDRYELQSRRLRAPYQEPEIIWTICEANNNSMLHLDLDIIVPEGHILYNTETYGYTRSNKQI